MPQWHPHDFKVVVSHITVVMVECICSVSHSTVWWHQAALWTPAFSSALSALSDPSYPEPRGGRGAPAFLLLLLPQSEAVTATAKPRCDHRRSDRR